MRLGGEGSERRAPGSTSMRACRCPTRGNAVAQNKLRMKRSMGQVAQVRVWSVSLR